MVNERDIVPRVLDVIRVAGRPLTISAISREVGVDRHTVSHILEILRLRGQVLYLHQGMAKKYYIRDSSPDISFPSAPADLIIIVDHELNLYYVNEAAARYLKIPAKNLTGKKLDSLFHPVFHHPEFFMHLQETSSQKVAHITLTISREDGSSAYPVTITTIGIPDKGAGTLIIIEEARADNGAQAPLDQDLIAQLSPGIIVANLDGVILHANPSFLLSTGYPDESDILGHPITDITGEDPYFIDSIVHLGTYHSHFQERIVKRRDGSPVFCLMHWELIKSPSDVPLYITGIILDISRRGELTEKIATLEGRFRDIVEGISDVIWETGADFSYTYISPAIRAVTGYSPDELIGTPPLWLSYSASGEDTRKIFSGASTGGPPILIREHSLEHKDGHRVIVETRAIPLLSATGEFRGYRGIDRDITGRKQVEDALKNEKQRLASIIDGTQVGTWEWNIQTGETRFNEQWAEIIGYTLEEISPVSIQTWTNFVHPEDLKNSNELLEKHFRRESERYECECRMMHKNGHWVWVLDRGKVASWTENGTPLWMFGTHHDITESKRAVDVLRKSEERLRSITKNSPDIIILINSKWEILTINRTVLLKDEDVIGRSVLEFIPPEFQDKAVFCFEKVRITGKPAEYYTEYHFPTTGTRFFASKVGPVLEGGEIAALVINSRDITERRKVEEALRVSEAKYRGLFENALVGFFRTTPDGRPLESNTAFAKIFGYRNPAEMNREISDIITQVYANPDDRKKFMAILAVQGYLEPTEVRLRHRDGHLIWTSVTAHSVKDDNGKILEYEGTLVDITERKRAEEALQKSEEQYRSLVETTGTGYVILDKRGRVITANHEYVRLTGRLTLDEIQGRPVTSWTAPHDIERNAFEIERCIINGQVKGLEIDYVYPDGTLQPVEVNASCIQSDSEQIIVTLCRDITNRKRVAAALQKSEGMFRLLFNHQRDAVAVHKMGKDGQPKNFILVNDFACKRLGYTREEMCTLSPQDIDAPEYSGQMPAVIEQLVKSNHALFETEHIAKGGHRVPVEVSSVRFLLDDSPATMSVARDITERKRVGEALRESEEKYRSLTEQVHDGIFLYQGDHFLYTNSHTSEISGYSQEELLTIPFIDFVHPDDQADIRNLAERRLKGEPIPDRYGCRFIRKDGEVRDLEIAMSVIPYKGGFAALGAARDVTERKRADEMILQALREKEVLLREVHHRVKNNLAGIISLINLQAASLTDPALIIQFRDLENRIRSMALVHESLYETTDVACIRLDGYTDNLARYLFQVYEISTKIECRIDMGDITLPIETATPCGLVMTEIITNSLKYAFPKTFPCEEIRGEPCTIHITLQRVDHDYLLNIRDNGIGIPEGKDVAMSNSLGLFLVRFIVEHQLQGTLTISTDNGTLYTIRFPEPVVRERTIDE